MSTFTANLDLELVARNGDTGVWDTPTNSNWSITDAAIGGIATISLNNSNVILNAAQFQSKQITFNSTLTGSVFITFPTSFTKSYEIQNLCTGSSAFTVVLQTASTAAGIQGIGCPPGQTITVFNDATNMKFTNLPPIGSYVDFATATVPLWISVCTVPPYVSCDGSTFSAGTYPALNALLGGNTLPDARGRARFAVNAGTGRITTAVSGVDGNTALASGGAQSATLNLANLPPITPTGTITNGAITINNGTSILANIGGTNLATSGSPVGVTNVNITATQAQSVFTGNSFGTSAPFPIMPPTLIGGITMIRAG